MTPTASEEADEESVGVSRGGGRVHALVRRLRGRIPIPLRGFVGLVVGYLILRVAAVFPVHKAIVYYDSGEYRFFRGGPHYRYVDLLGHAIRPWVVPLFYVVFPGDRWRVAAQLIVSIASWFVLACVVALSVRDRRVQVAGFVLVLVTSCAVAITNWDLIILSESLSLSLAALTLAAWLRWIQRRTVLSVVATVSLTGLLMFTRTSLVPLVGVLALGVAASAIWRRARALKLVTAAALLVVMGWGLVVVNNVEHAAAARTEGVGYLSQNFLLVLRTRILTDPGTLRWFRDHGMPAPTGIRPPSPNDGGFARVLADFAANTKLRHWVEKKSAAALILFSLERPDKFPRQFVRELPVVLTPSVGDLVYAPVASVLPPPIESILTPTTELPASPGKRGTPVALASFLAIFVGSAFLPRRRPLRRSALIVVIAAVLLSAGGVYLAWLGSPVEVPRHAVPFTQIIPLMLMFGTLLFIDAAIAAPELANASTGDAGGVSTS